MMSENKRNLTEKEEYYKLITDEKSNHIETNANGAGSQCVRRKNIGSLSFRERYLSLRKEKTQSFGKQTVAFHIYSLHPVLHPLLGLSSNRFVHLSLKFITLGRSYLSKVALKHILEINEVHIANLFHILLILRCKGNIKSATNHSYCRNYVLVREKSDYFFGYVTKFSYFCVNINRKIRIWDI